MLFIQAIIALLILFANIHFGWTDNGFLAAAWAGCAAFLFGRFVEKINAMRADAQAGQQ